MMINSYDITMHPAACWSNCLATTTDLMVSTTVMSERHVDRVF